MKAKFALYRETLRTTGAGKPRGIFHRSGEFATIPSPPPRSSTFNNTGAPQYAFSRQGGIFRSDVVQTKTKVKVKVKTKSWGGTNRLPLVGPGPRQRTRREDHALLIVRDEFRTGYSLIGLLASRARRRFTGTAIIKLWTIRRKRIIIER